MKIRNIAGNIQTLLLSHICVSVLFLLLIFELGLEMEPVAILIYACLSAGSYYMLLKNEWETSRDLSLEIVYLVGCVFRFVIPSFVTSWMIFNDSKIIYINCDVSDYAFPTIVWMNIFHIIFYTIFKLKSNNISLGGQLRVLFEEYDVFLIVAAIYIISFPFRVVNNLLVIYPLFFCCLIVRTNTHELGISFLSFFVLRSLYMQVCSLSIKCI